MFFWKAVKTDLMLFVGFAVVDEDVKTSDDRADDRLRIIEIVFDRYIICSRQAFFQEIAFGAVTF